MKKNEVLLLVPSSFLAVFLITLAFVYFSGIANVFQILLIVAFGVFISPLIFLRYNEHRKVKELEEIFPVFLRDFVESVRSGMTIPQALKSLSSNDYKTLSPYVKKMAAQVDWGINVDKVLQNFAKESKSRVIARIVSSVIETHRFGGNLTDTLEALANTALEIERLRTERKLYLQSQMITGYVIFFVFLAVMIIMQRFLIPSLSQARNPLEQTQQGSLTERYKLLFQNLIIIQGFFAGLIVGKMSEGAVVAGIKHSLFMISAGMIVFLIFG
ncbi:MAG: type II secretion system F family protein [Candidatus Aenigmatarchaeota archaeon]